MELEIHLHQRLLHVLDVRRRVIQQAARAGADRRATPRSRPCGRKLRAQQTVLMKTLQPLCIADVGLAARHVLGVPGIDQQTPRSRVAPGSRTPESSRPRSISMATVLTPHSSNQSARRCRSSVKVLNVRTGSEARSGPTAATCIFAPTSIAAAPGGRGTSPVTLDRLVLTQSCQHLPASLKQREGLDCAGYQFPNRDRREASPLASAQQSMDHVFLRGSSATKNLPAAPLRRQIHTARPFLWPQAGRRPARVFLEVDDRLGALQALPEPGVFPAALRQLRRQRVDGGSPSGPAGPGVRAPKAPASRWRRQSVRVDEYSPFPAQNGADVHPSPRRDPSPPGCAASHPP